MALIWPDAFEQGSTAAIIARYDDSLPCTGVVAGRTNYALSMGSGGLEKRFSQGYQTLVIGVALYAAAWSDTELLQLYDSVNNRQLTLRTNVAGTLSLYRGTSTTGTLLATSTAISTGVWNYIELLATISATVGAYEVRVNEVSMFSASSVNTRNGAYDDIQRITLYSRTTGNGAADYIVDDYYIADLTAPMPLGNFFGNTKIESLIPSGNGDVIGWVKFNDSNYRNVDERPHNSDTDYNYSGTVNASDLYQMTNMSATSGNVRGIMATHVSRKDDAVLRAVRPIIKTGGVVYPGSNDSLTTSYAYYYEVWAQNPQTASEWTIAAINSLQLGIQTTS